MSVVRLIQGDVARPDAVAVGREALGNPAARAERELFYPYYWFLLRASWATLLGPQRGKVSCLVDARTRVASTSDPFETETVTSEAAGVLESTLDVDGAERLARRAAASALGKRQRALAPAVWTLIDRALVHKRFWVVRHEARRILVDGISGRVHPLGPVA